MNDIPKNWALQARLDEICLDDDHIRGCELLRSESGEPRPKVWHEVATQLEEKRVMGRGPWSRGSQPVGFCRKNWVFINLSAR